MIYDLRLDTGKVVQQSGDSPEAAARRYLDLPRDAVVVATRPTRHPRHAVGVLGHPDQIAG